MTVSKDSQKKPFVRSTRMKIENVVPGMVLAEDVRTAAGAALVTADTLLTSELIERLKAAYICYLYIATCETLKEFNPLRGKKAFLIDDSPFFRQIFTEMLYRMGMHVCGEADTAEECLQAAGRCKPDLVVMEIHLPKMDGRDAMERLRPKLPAAKFLVVSSDKECQTIIEAFKSGADDYIFKPIKWDTLKPRVLKLFVQCDEMPDR